MPSQPATADLTDDAMSGIQHLGSVRQCDQALLQSVLAQAQAKLAEPWKAGIATKKVFWVNLWQATDNSEAIAIEGAAELDLWVKQIVAACYPSEELALDGYGLTINPPGSRAQAWHIDYAADYSVIFIPMTRLTPANAIQHVVLPRSRPDDIYREATKNLDSVDLDLLVDACEWVSIRQTLAPPFGILKLDFGTIHRAPANTGTEERIMFWISAQRKSLPPIQGEPPLMVCPPQSYPSQGAN